MADGDSKPASRWSWLENKMVLLLTTTALTVIVGPWLTDRIGRGQAIQQRRIDAALEITRRGIEVDRRLAQVHVRLSNFHRDVWIAKLRGRELRTAQKELIAKVSDDYQEFHRVGWAWHYEVSAQLKALGATNDDETAVLEELGAAYSRCLELSVAELDRLGAPLTTGPRFDSLDATFAATIERRFKDNSKIIRVLVEQMAQLFAQHRRPANVARCSAESEPSRP